MTPLSLIVLVVMFVLGLALTVSGARLWRSPRILQPTSFLYRYWYSKQRGRLGRAIGLPTYEDSDPDGPMDRAIRFQAARITVGGVVIAIFSVSSVLL